MKPTLPLLLLLLASLAPMSGCLLLEERPRTDECIRESVVLGGSADDEGESIVLPDEPELFGCEGGSGDLVEMLGYVIELHSENYSTEMVRAIDNDGQLLRVALLSPTCEQLPACTDWTELGAPLPIGFDERRYLVVRPLPTSTSIRLELVDAADLCPTTFDGECDEPDTCPVGTDSFDCE